MKLLLKILKFFLFDAPFCFCVLMIIESIAMLIKIFRGGANTLNMR